MQFIKDAIGWVKARLAERNTKLGIVLLVAAFAAPYLGFNYADAKDALLVLGAGLFAATDRAAE